MTEVITGPVGRQLGFALVGVALCLVVSRLDYRFLAQGSAGMYFGLIALAGVRADGRRIGVYGSQALDRRRRDSTCSRRRSAS